LKLKFLKYPIPLCYYKFMKLSFIYRIVFLCILTFGLVMRFIYNDLSVLAYFTIQSNLFIWAWWLLKVTYGRNNQELLIFHPGFKGALLLYILTTGILYQVLLAGTIEETSVIKSILLQINHGITPIAFLIDWIFFTPRKVIVPKYLFLWLIYPAFYLLISILYGVGNGVYLYYFLDINKLGINSFLVSLGGLMVFFLLLSSIILFIHNAWCRKQHAP